jgi:hypothetical protein
VAVRVVCSTLAPEEPNTVRVDGELGRMEAVLQAVKVDDAAPGNNNHG